MIRLFSIIFSLLISANSYANTKGDCKKIAAENYSKEKKAAQWEFATYSAIGLAGVASIVAITLKEEQLKDQKQPRSLLWGTVSKIISGVITSVVAVTVTKWSVLTWLQQGTKSFLSAVGLHPVKTNLAKMDTILTNLLVLKCEYEHKKDTLSASAQELFKKLETSADVIKAGTNLVLNTEEETIAYLTPRLQDITKLMRTILELPSEVKTIKPGTSIVIQDFPEELHEDLGDLVDKIISNAEKHPSKKIVAYLKGAPGLGKTNWIKQLAKTTELPLIEIYNFEKAFLNRDSIFTLDGFINKSFQLTELTKSLIGKPKNTILLIENFDSSINQKNHIENSNMNTVKAFLEQLLDPSRNTIILPDLGIEIDTSKFTIIAIGSEHIDDESFKDKMTLIEFPCFDLQTRQKIAQKYYGSANSDVDSTIQEIANQDPYCGSQSLKLVIDDYVHAKERGKDKNFNIQRAFNKHQSTQRPRPAASSWISWY